MNPCLSQHPAPTRRPLSQPHAVMYPWRVQAPVKNDYFMYSTQECLAVGGQVRTHGSLCLLGGSLHGL